MTDVELGQMGRRGSANPLHQSQCSNTSTSLNHRRRSASVKKISSFSQALTSTSEDSALTTDAWLLQNSLDLGTATAAGAGQQAGQQAGQHDRARGLVRHTLDNGRVVFFISDWKHLWNHFATDPTDTFGDNFTFFRDMVYFLCHFQTLRIAIYVVMYSFIIGIICLSIYRPDSSATAYVLIINPSLFCLLYLWVYTAVRGPLKRVTVAPNILDTSQVSSLLPSIV
jgi:hypothetical protein